MIVTNHTGLRLLAAALGPWQKAGNNLRGILGRGGASQDPPEALHSSQSQCRGLPDSGLGEITADYLRCSSTVRPSWVVGAGRFC